MLGSALRTRLRDAIGQLAPSHGLELVDVEIAGTRRNPIVRVYLDKEGGIDLDAVAEASRWISEMLDEFDGLESAYTLEASSPGIERPLVQLADFERFAGTEATVHTVAAINGRRNFNGVIVSVEGEHVVMLVDDTEYRIPHADIRTARRKVHIEF